MAVIVIVSFDSGPILRFPPEVFSFERYAGILELDGFLDSVRLSLIVASIVVIIDLLLGVPASIALVRGNHEDTIARKTERAVFSEIVAGVKQRAGHDRRLSLGYCGYIRLRLLRGGVQSWALDLFCHHGWGGGRLAGAKALKLERAIQRFAADLVMVGHWHTRQTVPGSVIALNRRGTRVQQAQRRGIVTGHWLRGYTQDTETYVERAGYPPSPVGCPVVELRPGDKSLKVVV